MKYFISWVDRLIQHGRAAEMPMTESAHNNLTPDKQDAWLKRSEEVLAAIVHGGQFVPNPQLTRPWRSYP